MIRSLGFKECIQRCKELCTAACIYVNSYADNFIDLQTMFIPFLILDLRTEWRDIIVVPAVFDQVTFWVCSFAGVQLSGHRTDVYFEHVHEIP